MTVSELIDKLKDCAPGAEVKVLWPNQPLATVQSDGERVVLK